MKEAGCVLCRTGMNWVWVRVRELGQLDLGGREGPAQRAWLGCLTLASGMPLLSCNRCMWSGVAGGGLELCWRLFTHRVCSCEIPQVVGVSDRRVVV